MAATVPAFWWEGELRFAVACRGQDAGGTDLTAHPACIAAAYGWKGWYFGSTTQVLPRRLGAVFRGGAQWAAGACGTPSCLRRGWQPDGLYRIINGQWTYENCEEVPLCWRAR